MKDPLEILKDTCVAFMAEHPAFWILSGLMDVSYETRASSQYRNSCATLRMGSNRKSPGFPDKLVDEMCRGVNSYVVSILKSQNPEFGEIHDNRLWKEMGNQRPDIRWGVAVDSAVVEIKAVWEGTMLKYYGPDKGTRERSVASDKAKLQKWQKRRSKGHYLQAVFFREMPNYRYPAGATYNGKGPKPKWETHCDRECSLIRSSIEAQYRQVRCYLTDAPAWPVNAPEIVPLVLPDELTVSTTNWFDSIFRPIDSSWQFDLAKQLAGAKVGCAIWKY